MAFRVKTPPTEEPVTLEEAKIHLNVDVDEADNDDYIRSLIKAAREHIESYTRLPLITQTKIYYSDYLCGEIELTPNLLSIVAIRYLDTSNVQQTLPVSDYDYDSVDCVGGVFPAYNKSWPSVLNYKNSVEIEFTCGFGAAAAVPAKIKQAILLLVGHWFLNRESVLVGVNAVELPMAVSSLINPYRVISF